jgi:hypothetical protein
VPVRQSLTSTWTLRLGIGSRAKSPSTEIAMKPAWRTEGAARGRSGYRAAPERAESGRRTGGPGARGRRRARSAPDAWLAWAMLGARCAGRRVIAVIPAMRQHAQGGRSVQRRSEQGLCRRWHAGDGKGHGAFGPHHQ